MGRKPIGETTYPRVISEGVIDSEDYRTHNLQSIRIIPFKGAKRWEVILLGISSSGTRYTDISIFSEDHIDHEMATFTTDRDRFVEVTSPVLKRRAIDACRTWPTLDDLTVRVRRVSG